MNSFPLDRRKFKVGDHVIIVRGATSIAKRKDVGREAVICQVGNSFDWRINMLHHTSRLRDGYDWGANEEDLDYAGGPW